MDSPATIIAELSRLHDEAVAALRADIDAYVAHGAIPDPRRRALWCYPELRIHYGGEETRPDPIRAFGRLGASGTYACTITRPALFADYLTEQLDLLCGDYSVRVEVARSTQEIPFAYVLDGQANLAETGPAELARHFPSTDLAHIGDELADGLFVLQPDAPKPLALFDGLRTDFSLARLAHYTGTVPEHFQRFILFTNYHRYVDEFVRWAGRQLGENGYTALAGAGGLYLEQPVEDAALLLSDTAWRRHQMPAYHLIGPGRDGISLVNIGVGPSNAKTICDHLAVLRPEAWLMIGHCGGLRDTQRIGDYVLAHAYLRDDHVLDPVLPPEVPIPAIAEVQVALAKAAEMVSGAAGADLKKRMRTGTVVTTDDRNWELRYRRCGWGNRARSASTWRARPLPRRAIASACPTAPCCACRTSRSTARSSCPARPIASTRKRSAPTSPSASPPANCSAPKARACIHASSGRSTNRRSGKAPPRQGPERQLPHQPQVLPLFCCFSHLVSGAK